jgi:hypothetical protein
MPKAYGVEGEVVGLRETLKALNKLGKDANAAARKEVSKISQYAADKTASAGSNLGGRYEILAQTPKVRRDRVPTVAYGGARRSPVSGGATYNQLLYGMEFGADASGRNAWRFPPRSPRLGSGNAGYWIYPTARRMQSDITRMWQDAIDAVMQEFGDG